MSAGDQLGDDRSHEEALDIKMLLKLIVETQAKQAESQKQIMEMLRITNSAAGNNHKQQEEEINDATANDHDNQRAAEVEVHPVAVYVPGKNDQLYEALSTNDIEKVKEILKNNPEVVKEGITHDSSTVLHTAVHWKMDIMIVEEILKLMSPDVLEYKTKKYGYTACHRAAIYGYAKAVVVMVKKNSKLTQIRDSNGSTPLELALQYPTLGQKEIVEYLYSVTRDEDPSPFSGQDGVRLLHRAIDANFYDMALCLVKRFPKLVTEKSLKDNICALEVLVRRPFAFKSGAKLTWWQDRIYSFFQVDMSSKYVQPVEPSTFGFVLISVPHLQKLYNLKLIHEQAIALLKQMLVEVNNNYNNPGIRVFYQNDPGIRIFFQNNPGIMKVAIKHGVIEVVVELAPSAQLNLVSGVALQMQRELQWFKGVENIMTENDRFKRNKNGDTAQHIFTNEHKDLLKKGEDWMKDTSGSCMVVAALIATVAFAAAFTVPGGNINDNNSVMNGTPVFLGNTAFTVFVVADSLALFASITSVLMFLAIYTSRYAEMDFLKPLPQKLIIGFATLFTSMAAILVAFGASLFIVVGGRFPWAPIPIALFTSCPILLFACLQLPLFYGMVHSTYCGSILKKHRYISHTTQKNKKRK
ncbi:hypothetical protein MKW92_027558 [Papaver armeniacum]|nr:hypothetical protein MKW92_027558 [Papaver armeniacum]